MDIGIGDRVLNGEEEEHAGNAESRSGYEVREFAALTERRENGEHHADQSEQVSQKIHKREVEVRRLDFGADNGQFGNFGVAERDLHTGVSRIGVLDADRGQEHHADCRDAEYRRDERDDSVDLLVCLFLCHKILPPLIGKLVF